MRPAQAGAEQQLQGSERPGGEHHLVGLKGPTRGLDGPAGAQPGRSVLGKDLGAEALGLREVRAVERVLRPVAAADHAAAAQDALLEVHRHRRRPVGAGDAELRRDPPEDHIPRAFVGRLDGAQHPPRRFVVRRQLVAPAGEAVPDRARRLVEDVRVDQRAAADACAGQHDHVAQEGDALDSVAAEPRREEEAPQVPARAGEVLRREPPPLLEHGDRVALLGQPQRGHRAAEAAAHDDDVEPPHSSAGRISPALPSTRRSASPSSAVGP